MLESILWILFTLGCVFVSALILLQEGKGGGLGEAFGGAGAQTFGVKAQGISKFTGYMVGGLVVLAIVITQLRTDASGVARQLQSASETEGEPDPGAGLEPPGDGGGTPGDAGGATGGGTGPAGGAPGGTGETPAGGGDG